MCTTCFGPFVLMYLMMVLALAETCSKHVQAIIYNKVFIFFGNTESWKKTLNSSKLKKRVFFRGRLYNKLENNHPLQPM